MKKVLAVAFMLLCVVAIHAQTTPGASSTVEVASATSPVPTPTPTAPAKTETKHASAEGKPAKAKTKSAAVAAKPASAKPGSVLPPEKANPVRLPRFDKPPVIDGKLDDEVWKQAVVLKDFYQVQPGDNIAPSKATEVLLGYDAKFLYLAYRAYDEPGKVRANVAKRDAIFDDDYVGLFFDTFNDTRKAYEMNFNPLGIQADGILTEGQGEDFSVDLVVDSKGMVTENGYTVEVAIPFKSLRYEAGKDKLWGAHFYRRIKRFNNELDMWMPISRDQSSWLSQEGHLTGLEGISTERTLELIPSLTLQESGKRVRSMPDATAQALGITDRGRFVNKPIGFDPGLTAKFGLTPTVTLDFALNPDFAQVESDQLVITANQRFPIFFEEKRPFFLEGIDIFRTQISAVHTRTIVNPQVAAKLSGKLGRNSFGFMVAADKGPGNITEEDLEANPNDKRFVNKKSYVGVLRLKHDVGKDSNVGFLATSYNFKEKHNQLAGFDGRFRFNKTTTFDAQVLGTISRQLFYDSNKDQSLYQTRNGMAWAIDLNDDGRHWGYELSGVGRSRDFRSDVGFNRRTNTNNFNLFMRYNSEPRPKATLISWRIFTIPQVNFDWQGRMQRWNHNTQLSLNFPLQGFIGLGVQEGYERVFEEEFGPTRTFLPDGKFRPGQFAGNDNERAAYRKNAYAYGGITPSKKYSAFVLVARDWGVLDFDFGAGRRFPRVSPGALLASRAQAQGLCDTKNGTVTPPAICNAQQDPGAGNQWHIEANLTYQPTSALRTSLDLTKERLVRNDTGQVAYDDNIFSARATYQFTRFTFARARLDYDTLASSVKGQFLLGWTPNPGTAFYVGYNDDMNRNGFNPFNTNQNILEPGLRRNSRTFFIKMSYLFRRSF